MKTDTLLPMQHRNTCLLNTNPPIILVSQQLTTSWPKKLEIRHSNLQELHRKPYHWEAKRFSNTACVTVNLTACFITKVHVTEEKFKTFNVVLYRNENFEAKTT